MHVTPQLTTAASQRWSRIPAEAQEEILAKIYCGTCNKSVLIIKAEGKLDFHGDIILRGHCAICGSPVCRLIETGETMGPPETYP
jgi:hypothetical protein